MRFVLLALFATLLSSTLLLANEYEFTDETELQKIYTSTISNHFYKQKVQYFYSINHFKIAYKIFSVHNEKATIVISSGRTEGMVKYKELIYDLNRNGYSIYILDHRGQGYSDRLLNDTQIGHVDNFLDYVLDLKYFVDKIVPKDKKRILLAHSMGATIASLYVEMYKRDFDAAVLSSPMHQPGVLSKLLSVCTCHLLQKYVSKLKSYSFGTSSYDDTEHKFTENLFTHSKIRYEITKSAYKKEPFTKIGGPSFRWVSQACLWSRISIDNADKIEVPVLLLQAAEDKIVDEEAQEEFCANVGEACTLERFQGAYHEMFMEKDGIREKVLGRVLDFISKI